MLEILSEYNRVEEMRVRIGGKAFFSHCHKKDREWHVLGATQQLLIRGGFDAPSHAQEHEAPDFYAYRNGDIWAAIEIVEILKPGYRRQDFYKQEVLSNEPTFFSGVAQRLEHPWQPLRDQIFHKAAKAYPPLTWLVIYYDIGRLSFEDWTTPFHNQLLAEHADVPFTNLGMFGCVLILSSDMQCLVQIHPSPIVITPDTQN